jgi:hypothetical protein
MANEQTSVPLYAASEVLTAANMNISAGTGVPVFATTVTRDAAFGGANEKTLAEGQLCYLSASNIVQYYDGAAWATVGPAAASGLVLVATATPTAVASVSINSCFTSTYAAYLIESIVTTGVGANAVLGIRLRASGTDTTTNYVSQRTEQYSTTIGTGLNVQGTDEWPFGIVDPTGKGVFGEITLQNPNVADQTTMAARFNGRQADLVYIMSTAGGIQTASTQFDGITFFTTGTSFTGIIRVYGIANS